ncbi:MAG: hypothetical protein LUF89_04480 [Ruminococcus sp.]|nr:hypothetical protein [Ruminococcus sp.]
MTVLGKTGEAVVVLCYQGKIDVIDLTGNYKNPEYIKYFLTDNGVREISTLCLTKRSTQLRVCYEETLAHITATEAVVSTDCHMLEGTTLCSAIPQKSDEFYLNDATYSAAVQDETVQLTYGNLHFCIVTKMSDLPEGEWDAIICLEQETDLESVPK